MGFGNIPAQQTGGTNLADLFSAGAPQQVPQETQLMALIQQIMAANNPTNTAPFRGQFQRQIGPPSRNFGGLNTGRVFRG